MPKKPAIFIDRDNTLTRDLGYTWDIADFDWIDGAVEALQLFSKAGLDIFIVTNQGGIGRGFFTEADMHAFHAHLQSELAKAAILTALQALGEPLDAFVGPTALIREAEAGVKKAKFDKLDYLDFATLPPLKFASGKAVSADVPRWWVYLGSLARC